MHNGSFPRSLLALSALCGLTAVTIAQGTAPKETTPNRLTPTEAREGWTLLFDGETTTEWRGFRSDRFPTKGWKIEAGCIKHTRRGGGGDIITTTKYSEFDFKFEWKVGQGANGGVKYFLIEDRGRIGHEYQLLDDRASWAKGDRKHCTASFYDVLPVTGGSGPKPAGEFNTSRILVRGNRVEQWLNGEMTIAYELGSPEVLAAVAQSKFKTVRGFGAGVTGHLLLQDHGGEIWFRNLKVRDLAR